MREVYGYNHNRSLASIPFISKTIRTCTSFFVIGPSMFCTKGYKQDVEKKKKKKTEIAMSWEL